MNFFIYIVIFVFGAIVGSFLNVCIWRLPRQESVLKPGSHCPSCNKPVQWFDNIPIFSFIFLSGRCRNCRAKISFRYPFIELLAAVLFIVNFIHFGISAKFFIYTALECALIVGTFTDFMHFIIPDEITLGGVIAGLILSFLFPQLYNVLSPGKALFLSILGAVTGGGIVFIIRFLFDLFYFKIFKHPSVEGNTESMGDGDIKLLAMIGAFIGWQKALLVFFVAPFFAIIIAVLNLAVKKTHVNPYGPYLSLAAFVIIMWGDKFLKLLFPM